MMQMVRRQSSALNSGKFLPNISKKARLLEVALLSLAATNTFIVSSAVAFYWLSHKH